MREENGAVAIIVALCAVALFIVAALVVDLGLARDVRRQSQNAADASALAAANVLYPASGACMNGSATPCYEDAVSAAMTYAEQNFAVSAAEWGGCTDTSHFYVVPGKTSCISFTDDASTKAEPSRPTKVRVVVPTRTVPTGLGALAGVEEVPVGSRAEAGVSDGVDLTCALCFLGDVDSGNADYTVNGGSIAVNGNVSLGANGNMIATGGGSVGVAGSYSSGEGFSPQPVVEIPNFTDPLADLSLPAGKSGLSTKSGSPCDNGPGVYGDFAVPNRKKKPCVLPTGLYIITGTWSLKNNSTLTNASGGVTLYFTCGSTSSPAACSSTGSAGGQLYGKNGTVQLTARTSGSVADYAVIYDRTNTQSVQLQGNGDSFIDGGVYAKSAALEFNGNSFFTITAGPVVADSVIKANGNKSGVNVNQATGANYATRPGSIGLTQ